MKNRRARRGEVGLVKLASGAWGIRWGRRLSRGAGVPLVESTQTRDRSFAQQVLDRRHVEVMRSLGEEHEVAAIARRIRPIPLDQLVTECITEYGAGKLDGRTPAKGTIELYVFHLLGNRGGLLPFATEFGATLTHHFSALLVTRWLEAEAKRLSSDSVRMKLNVARRLARYGHARGFVTRDALDAVLALRPAPSAKGRARRDGVPSMAEVDALMLALQPRRERGAPWHRIALLQLHLGLRRGELFALDASWLDEENGRVVVRAGEQFDTKSHESRDIDGVSDGQFALAREVIALKAQFHMTTSGYKEAWERACQRLAAAGTPWKFRSKSHSLRAVYATESRLAGIPLSIVSRRLGHSSEAVTERHYLGRTSDVVRGPFPDPPRAPAALSNLVDLADWRPTAPRRAANDDEAV